MNIKRKNQGFTLTELAVVIVVIGLLVLVFLIGSDELPKYQQELLKLENVLSNNEFIQRVNEIKENGEDGYR